MKRVALYARCSTAGGDQNPETQLRDLRDYCRARGWEHVTEYVDHGMLGRPRLRIDARQLERVVSRGLTVREGAKEVGISPSSFLRVGRQHDGRVNGSAALLGGIG